MDQVGQPVSDQNDALTLGAAKQVMAAVALGERMAKGGSCTLDDICDIHRILFERTRDQIIGGTLRDGPIWIGPAGCRIDEASFVAPPNEMVPALMNDLVSYLNSNDHPAALQAAIAHAQFETIHPFDDGNGRTGRALIHTVLNARGLVSGTVPLSTALGSDIAGYHAALNATRVVCGSADSDSRSVGTQEWLALFCRACEDAGRQAVSVVQSVEALAASWLASAAFRSDSAASALLKALPSMPVLDAKMAAEQLGFSVKAARAALNALERAQIVSPTGGRRNRRFIVPGLIDLVRGMGPDGVQSRRDDPRTRSTAVPVTACGHIGPRSKKSCVLPKGHANQHRY